MCDYCAATTINGKLCHEHGCPDKPRPCRWCGRSFNPIGADNLHFCERSCALAYYGQDDDDDNA